MVRESAEVVTIQQIVENGEIDVISPFAYRYQLVAAGIGVLALDDYRGSSRNRVALAAHQNRFSIVATVVTCLNIQNGVSAKDATIFGNCYRKITAQ